MTARVTTGRRSWVVRGVDGVPLTGRVDRAPGERAAVLLTHGLGEHLGRYAGLTEAFLAAGVTVLRYDQRGHGGSPGRRAVVDAGLLVEDHLAVRRAAAAVVGDLPLALHGHSLGGLVTAASVLRRPEGVSAVVLSSPALRLSDALPTVLVPPLRVAARLLPRLGTKRIAGTVISRLPEEVAAYDTDPLNHHGRVPLLAAASMMDLGPRVLAQAPRWRPPVLVVHGTADRLTDPDASRRFAREAGTARRPRPPVELVEVDGGHHECFHDVGAAEVADRTVRWVTARLG